MEPTIKRADEKLNFLSADQEVRRLAELREKGIADQKAREEYVIEKTQKQTARKMLDKGYPLDEISDLTGLPVETLMDLLKH